LEDCYTKPPHVVRTHLVARGGRLYYRRRVPEALRAIVGKREIWRSLGTDSLAVAKRRSLQVAAAIEHEFEVARSRAGLPFDQTVLDGAPQPTPPARGASGPTLGQLYDAYMRDPTRGWSKPTMRRPSHKVCSRS
jgi:hypothetical protein